MEDGKNQNVTGNLIAIEGTEATIDSVIPEDFFEGMETLTSGKALGIVVLKSAAGGRSEVCVTLSAVNKVRSHLISKLISCLCGGTKRWEFAQISTFFYKLHRILPLRQPPPRDPLNHQLRNHILRLHRSVHHIILRWVVHLNLLSLRRFHLASA